MVSLSSSTHNSRSALWAYVLPFAVFMAAMSLVSGLGLLTPAEDASLWLSQPVYWVYPLQTLLCAALLIWFWKDYEWGKSWGIFTGVAAGLVVLALWISPQWIFGTAPRMEGFNPDTFANSPALWWGTVSFRFLRLVIVVPLLEEIFWRGFLMRYLIKEDFIHVAFGTFTTFSFGAVVVLFGLAHWGPDFFPAILTGAIYNLVAMKTRSLVSCVVAHAVTNLGLGLYIMQTKQWGFW